MKKVRLTVLLCMLLALTIQVTGCEDYYLVSESQMSDIQMTILLGVGIIIIIAIIASIAMYYAGKDARKKEEEEKRQNHQIYSGTPKLGLFCPKCGSPMPVDANFCRKCGRKLT